jgi:ATP-dependent helicase/nuclease subunit A
VSDLTRAQALALDLERSMAVSAGAGAGKTRVLVERYLWFLEAAPDPAAALGQIVAITFTEKAAEEMKGRVRARLFERSRAEPRWRALAAEIDEARISTIHAFCARLLREHALAAGLDPDFRILSGADAALLCEAAIQKALVVRAESGNPDLGRLLEIWSRRQITRALKTLFARRYPAALWARQLAALDDEALVTRWRARTEISADELARFAAECAADLGMLARVGPSGLASAAGRLLGAAGDREREVAFACLWRAFLDRRGRLRRFTRGKEPWTEAAARVSARLAPLEARAITVVPGLDEVAPPYLRSLASLWGGAASIYRELKEAQAALDFDDLEERALHLLEEDAQVRASVRAGCRALLVDEVQDVSEIQWRILRSVASGDDGALRPAALFAVGDEKQSIYRFRGAEVTVFGRIRAAVREANAARAALPARLPPSLSASFEPDSEERLGLLSLRDNFRSLEPPLRFVNHVFARLFGEPREDFEARHEPLVQRRTASATPVLAGTDLLLVPRRGSGDDEFLRTLDEATAVARYLAAGSWLRGAAPETRFSDCAILLWGRQSLKTFEAELRRFGIPFVVLGGVGFYQAQEVIDLAALLGFLADDRSDIDLAAVLRSPLGAFPDDLLYAVARSGSGSLWSRLGRFDPARPPVPVAPDVARRAARVRERIERWRELADRIPLSDLMARALEESGAFAALAWGPRGPQRVANVEKLLDLARRFEAESGLGIAAFVERLRVLGEIEEREGEADVPAGLGGVRLLTVHAAKGLEFPLVIVPEIGGQPPPQRDEVLLDELHAAGEDPTWEVGLRLPDPEAGWEIADTGLRQMLRARLRRKEAAERKRLLYVACTRAQDRLVLVGSVPAAQGSWLDELAQALEIEPEAPSHGPIVVAGVEVATWVDPEVLRAVEPPAAPAPPAPVSPDPGAVRALSFRLAPLDPGPLRLRLWPSLAKSLCACRVKAHFASRGLPEPAARGDGRRARVRGILVHRLLESGAWRRASCEALAREMAREEGISEGPELEALASDAAKTMTRFAASDLAARIDRADEVWTEIPFTLQLDAAEVTGRIDLLFCEAGRYCLVDYKSDEVAPEAVAAHSARMHYLAQVALYGAAVREWIGDRALEGGLYYTAPGVFFPADLSPAAVAAGAAWLDGEARVLLAGMPDPPPDPPCATCGYAALRVCPFAR